MTQLKYEGEHPNFPEMILVEGGTFMMGTDKGSENQRPRHNVLIDSFYIGRTEVTNRQFVYFLKEYNSIFIKEGKHKGKIILHEEQQVITRIGNEWQVKKDLLDYPIIYVTWYGALEYTIWLSNYTGDTYRLPTEAEWEYAAKGGNKSQYFVYSGSDYLNQVGWYDIYSEGRAHQVAKLEPNELGLFDMSGNVWEWCLDWYDKDYYKNSPAENPLNSEKIAGKVIRGGSWFNNHKHCYLVHRNHSMPEDAHPDDGFRVVREK